MLIAIISVFWANFKTSFYTHIEFMLYKIELSFQAPIKHWRGNKSLPVKGNESKITRYDSQERREKLH